MAGKNTFRGPRRLSKHPMTPTNFRIKSKLGTMHKVFHDLTSTFLTNLHLLLLPTHSTSLYELLVLSQMHRVLFYLCAFARAFLYAWKALFPFCDLVNSYSSSKPSSKTQLILPDPVLREPFLSLKRRSYFFSLFSLKVSSKLLMTMKHMTLQELFICVFISSTSL